MPILASQIDKDPSAALKSTAVLFICAIYLFVATRHLSCPGLGYDEVNWANVALGDLDGSWIRARVFGIPWLLSLPYIGTVKGFLMGPVFQVFGVSAVSVRLPVVILGVGILVATYWVARGVFERWWQAAMVLLLLAVNPDLVLRLRQDFGPVGIDFLLKVLVVIAALAFARRPVVAVLAVLVLLEALGLWNKLTFVWYICAVNLAYFVIYRDSISALLRPAGRPFLALLILSQAALAAYFLVVYFHFDVGGFETAGQTQIGISDRMASFAGMMFASASGVLSVDFSFDEYQPLGGKLWGAIKLAMAAVGFFTMIFRPSTNRAPSFVGTVGVMIIAFMAATKAADKPWHIIAAEPFVTIAFVWGATFLGATFLGWRRIIIPALVLILGLLTAGQTWAHLDRVVCKAPTTLRGVYRAISSMAIYPLIDFVGEHQELRYIVADWSIRNQLLLFTKNRKVVAGEIAADGIHQRAAELFADPLVAFIVHAPIATCFWDTRDALFQEAADRGVTLRLIRTFSDGADPVIELWAVDPA
jgi:hypothetical protein